MRIKPAKLILLNVTLVLAAFFLAVLALEYVIPGLMAFEGALPRAALAVFAVAAVLVCATDIAQMLRAKKRRPRPPEGAQAGSSGAESPTNG